MSFVTKTDKTVVNDSIKIMIDKMPLIIKSMVSIFIKYGKLIDEKYISLSQSDEKRRIRGIKNINSLMYLSFDKLLFALDKDLYIDFMNEIKYIQDEVCFNYIDFDHKRDCENGIRLGSISFKYLVHPSDPVGLITSNFYGDLKDRIPLIKVTPEFNLSSSVAKQDDMNYYLPESANESTCGINLAPTCANVEIDITSLFDIIGAFSTYDRYLRRKNDSIENIKEYSKFHKITLASEESINEFIENVSDIMSNRIVYSMATTYMTTITKIQDIQNNMIGDTFGDILNSCRKTMFDNFDSCGENLNTGMALRHMAIDVGSLLNAISYTNYKLTSTNEYWLLYHMITYMASLKYETYNYQKIPMNNLNHKKLISIVEAAKPYLYMIDPDVKAELQCCYESSEHKNPLNFFVSKDFIKVDGTYALNKRIYDTGKDFIDVFAKFIVIKKRMNDAGALNSADGNIDKIGKRYIDYKSYLKTSYNEIKVSLVNIFNRMKSVTLGKRYLVPNMMVKNDNSEAIKNANTIIYGINTESCFNDSWYTDSLFDDSHPRYVGYQAGDSNYYTNPNDKIKDIRIIYNTLKERESTYSNTNKELLDAINNNANGSLITAWISVTECIGLFFDSPFESVKNVIGKISMGYTIDSINEMAPNAQLYNSQNNEFREWSVKPDLFSSKSLEDLKLAFEDMKEKVEEAEKDGESVVGGLLFSDFGGMQLAGDVTDKEAELYNDQLSVTKVNTPEDVEAFESFKNEFDDFIENHL